MPLWCARKVLHDRLDRPACLQQEVDLASALARVRLAERRCRQHRNMLKAQERKQFTVVRATRIRNEIRKCRFRSTGQRLKERPPARSHGKPPSWRRTGRAAPRRSHLGEAALSPLRLGPLAERADLAASALQWWGEPSWRAAPLLHLHHHLEEPHRRLLLPRRPFDRLPLAVQRRRALQHGLCISAPVQRFTFGSHSTFGLPSTISMDTLRKSFVSSATV